MTERIVDVRCAGPGTLELALRECNRIAEERGLRAAFYNIHPLVNIVVSAFESDHDPGKLFIQIEGMHD